MITYAPTAADRAPLPTAFAAEPRYLGYREPERALPFAHFFRDEVRPLQEHAREALLGGKAPSEFGYDIDDAARILARPGYHKMETGWTRLDNGVTAIACLTDMPGVTAAMWDWWFGWHGRESARYKLWHPDSHQFSALGEDRGADRSLTDRQRYLDNVSYVDEYIGGDMHRLAIRFFDQTRLGLADVAGTTHICARVGFSTMPLAHGWLIHQIRPTDRGAEMRSRFFLNHPELLELPAEAVPGGVPARVLTRGLTRRVANQLLPSVSGRLLPANLGHDLLRHCATEMNHLASFLPQLYEEFNGTP
ncbi:MAG TPA: hypothetical protein VH008_14170 [Pseudonocardia sp.]|nr:hypothetical protein [Pseudonocardia sp.]